MNKKIEEYNNILASTEKEICDLLANTIDKSLTDAESKIWLVGISIRKLHAVN